MCTILPVCQGQPGSFVFGNPEVPDLVHVALTASWFENPEVLVRGIQKFWALTVT